MKKQKRAVAIHDISGFGKCSLTVALPVVSAAGIETVVMPTAVLSTHTGGFTGYTYRDLTEDMRPITEHWKSLDLKFDSIYTGFLGSFDQIEIVKEFVEKFKTPDNFVLVDPAMADYGKMYACFDMPFARAMASLCAKADIIVPNFTEAAFVLGEDYIEPPYTKEYVEGMLRRLCAMGPQKVVLTGVCFDDEQLGAACLDSKTGEIAYTLLPRLEGMYHGTGDVYASVLCAAMTLGFELKEAVRIATEFTHGCISRTLNSDKSLRYGVDFERGLPQLMKALGLYE